MVLFKKKMPSILTSGPPCHLIAFLPTDSHLLKIVGPPIQEVVQNMKTSYLTPIHIAKACKPIHHFYSYVTPTWWLVT